MDEVAQDRVRCLGPDIHRCQVEMVIMKHDTGSRVMHFQFYEYCLRKAAIYRSIAFLLVFSDVLQ